MKIFIPTILTLLFFSPTSVFAEEIKDVGLICKNNEVEDPQFRGFWFKGDQRMEWYIGDVSDRDNDGNTFEISYWEEWSNEWKYNTTKNEIRFHYYYKEERDSDRSIKLDRFTLEMEEFYFGLEITHQCEVFENKLDFNNGLKKKEESVRRHFEKRKI